MRSHAPVHHWHTGVIRPRSRETVAGYRYRVRGVLAVGGWGCDWVGRGSWRKWWGLGSEGRWGNGLTHLKQSSSLYDRLEFRRPPSRYFVKKNVHIPNTFFFKSMPTLSRLPKFQQKAKAKKKKTSRRHQINISWIQENEKKKKANEMDLKE